MVFSEGSPKRRSRGGAFHSLGENTSKQRSGKHFRANVGGGTLLGGRLEPGAAGDANKTKSEMSNFLTFSTFSQLFGNMQKQRQTSEMSNFLIFTTFSQLFKVTFEAAAEAQLFDFF